MSNTDRLALFFSLLAMIASAWVAQYIYERIPHLEDEIAYVWQARAIVDGHLTEGSPSSPKSFLVPFIVDYKGQRFSKYPPGWPVVLSMGVLLGLRVWVNPLLAGLGVWLIYRLGAKIFNRTVGVIAAGLTVFSPFMLLNSGSLLSHAWGLVLSAAFVLAWLDAFWRKSPSNVSPWLATITAALVMGVFTLSRPFTALGVALPFAVHGLYLMVRSDWATRRRLFVFGLLTILLAGLYFIWQYALTGNAFLNPYTLWWKYDKIGFGPGHGLAPVGHSIRQAWFDARYGMRVGTGDLFGWATYSWIFLPFGLWAMRRNGRAWMIASIFPSLVVLYMTYWVNAWIYGPRYYYESLYSLTLVSAVGICWLAGISVSADEPNYVRLWQKPRRLIMTALLSLLMAINLAFYLPARLGGMYGLYGIHRANLTPFETQEAKMMTPALIMVDTPVWMPYGALLDLQNPSLTSPFIFAWVIGPRTDASAIAAFPDRSVYYYYPDDPNHFYRQPRQSEKSTP